MDRAQIHSRRTEKISPFIVMEVLERAQQMERCGEHIVHLEVGEPDFATPSKIVEAGQAALARGETHYTHSLGIWPLREAIAEYYSKNYSIKVSPDQVIVTSGTSPALLLVLSAILNPGDEVICANPSYACYKNFIAYLSARFHPVKVYEDDGFQFRPEQIKAKITPKTKAILINSPSNPTGNLLSAQVMEQIAHLGPLVISDEIYHGLVYGDPAHSILEFSSNAVVLNGFSKLFAMTGWRLGYLIVPQALVRPIQKLQQNFFISANAFVQWAGVAALTESHPEIETMVATYDQRRKFMIERLRDLGFKISVEPTGAFYVFANAKRFCSNSYEFAFELLENAHVAVTPGIDFGTNGEGFLRFSYANSIDNIQLGVERIKRYLQTREKCIE
ncbi:MAG: pyridoxal phosphate-dependent aminotransferase [candidate division KSB1 bacterium]|nr:pyridoxal phosphate-dependent aminotransferase [candidate division KSB1 bacterium]MDZ7336100.1 pyridoxal phosphate-dependent aminotransferase [candidate division KSB1 bacterium]MDZ7356324.1 pyridoxal phosphate-dependent aminotransferase [candidate division KSB1 bacterium]MDZ7401918.1 pyridoxal phosphate-dependent aminotransferase [candidate division KSB1 bacterium]